MAEVHAFPGTADPDRPRDEQPVPGIVAFVEKLLDDAKAGRVRALAIAAVKQGDMVTTAWERPEDGDYGHQLAAAIGCLSHRYFASRVGPE